MRSHILRKIPALAPILAVAASLLFPSEARATSIVVDTLASGTSPPGTCSLQDAVFSASFNSSGWGACAAGNDTGTDEILFSVTGTIELAGTLVLSDDVLIQGPGASQLIIRRPTTASAFRLFQVNPGVAATLNDLTLENGKVESVNFDLAGGAAFYSSGALTLNGVVVRDNHSTITWNNTTNPAPPGGAIYSPFGSTLTITDSTISGNSLTVSQTNASGQRSAMARGGAIAVFGSLTIERSTISGNTATANVTSPDSGASATSRGGGIETSTSSPGSVTIRNSTISGNSAVANATGSAIANAQGGGLRTEDQSITITNSTFAGNSATAGANVYADPSNGGSVETVTSTILADHVGDGGCGSVSNDGGNNLVEGGGCTGLSAIALDPQLGPLQNNGGPTLTHAIPATSPAVDAGAAAGQTTDQRGSPRTVNFSAANATDGTDIGAFELQDTAPPTDPQVVSASHAVNAPSKDQTVDVSWSGASDGAGSGLDGYSYLFSTSPTTLPDTTKEPAGTSATSAPLPDGSHWFHLRTLDAAGNWTSTVHLGPFVIDTDAPETTITRKPKKRVVTPFARVRVRFRFVADEAGSAFECKLDGGAFKPCASPKTYRVKPGRHRFQVRAKDPVTNVDATPAVFTFRVIREL